MMCRKSEPIHNGDYGEDGSMAPYGNTGGPYGGVYAGGYGGYGTYGAYTEEDGILTYDLNSEGKITITHIASVSVRMYKP